MILPVTMKKHLKPLKIIGLPKKLIVLHAILPKIKMRSRVVLCAHFLSQGDDHKKQDRNIFERVNQNKLLNAKIIEIVCIFTL